MASPLHTVAAELAATCPTPAAAGAAHAGFLLLQVVRGGVPPPAICGVAAAPPHVPLADAAVSPPAPPDGGTPAVAAIGLVCAPRCSRETWKSVAHTVAGLSPAPDHVETTLQRLLAARSWGRVFTLLAGQYLIVATGQPAPGTWSRMERAGLSPMVRCEWPLGVSGAGAAAAGSRKLPPALAAAAESAPFALPVPPQPSARPGAAAATTAAVNLASQLPAILAVIDITQPGVLATFCGAAPAGSSIIPNVPPGTASAGAYAASLAFPAAARKFGSIGGGGGARGAGLYATPPTIASSGAGGGGVAGGTGGAQGPGRPWAGHSTVAALTTAAGASHAAAEPTLAQARVVASWGHGEAAAAIAASSLPPGGAGAGSAGSAISPLQWTGGVLGVPPAATLTGGAAVYVTPPEGPHGGGSALTRGPLESRPPTRTARPASYSHVVYTELLPLHVEPARWQMVVPLPAVHTAFASSASAAVAAASSEDGGGGFGASASGMLGSSQLDAVSRSELLLTFAAADTHEVHDWLLAIAIARQYHATLPQASRWSVPPWLSFWLVAQGAVPFNAPQPAAPAAAASSAASPPPADVAVLRYGSSDRRGAPPTLSLVQQHPLLRRLAHPVAAFAAGLLPRPTPFSLPAVDDHGSGTTTPLLRSMASASRLRVPSSGSAASSPGASSSALIRIASEASMSMLPWCTFRGAAAAARIPPLVCEVQPTACGAVGGATAPWAASPGSAAATSGRLSRHPLAALGYVWAALAPPSTPAATATAPLSSPGTAAASAAAKLGEGSFGRVVLGGRVRSRAPADAATGAAATSQAALPVAIKVVELPCVPPPSSLLGVAASGAGGSTAMSPASLRSASTSSGFGGASSSAASVVAASGALRRWKVAVAEVLALERLAWYLNRVYGPITHKAMAAATVPAAASGEAGGSGRTTPGPLATSRSASPINTAAAMVGTETRGPPSSRLLTTAEDRFPVLPRLLDVAEQHTAMDARGMGTALHELYIVMPLVQGVDASTFMTERRGGSVLPVCPSPLTFRPEGYTAAPATVTGAHFGLPVDTAAAGAGAGATDHRRHAPSGLGYDVAAQLVWDVALALAQCHALGIVHRDVKPENVQIVASQAGGSGGDVVLRAVLLDLGFAFLAPIPDNSAGPGGVDSGEAGAAAIAAARLPAIADVFADRWALRTLFGTKHAMAPELWAAADASAAASGRSASGGTAISATYGPAVDAWGLGVIAYLLLLGRLPFDDASGGIGEMKRLVMAGEMRQPEGWARLPATARHLLASLLCVDAAARATPRQVLGHAWLRQPFADDSGEEHSG